jgi:hypothetical protein
MTGPTTTLHGERHRPRRLRSQVSTTAPTMAIAAAAGVAANRSVTNAGATVSVAVRRLARLAAVAFVVVVVAGAIALASAPAASASELVLAQAPASFQALITNLRNWVVGLLVGLSTLFVTVGGIRLAAADGDPGEVERAKRSIRNGLVGYALAALAPMIVSALQSLVG